MRLIALSVRRLKAPIALLCVSMLAWALLAHVEFGGRSDLPMQLDELFFATCAARGLAAGEVPAAGCHDNKGPLIYLVYQAIQDPVDPYRLSTIKAAGFVLGGLVSMLAGMVAFRLRGSAAAILTSALAIQVCALDPWFLSLRTESLGLIFILIALLALLPSRIPDKYLSGWKIALAGFMCGLALLTRQNFLFLVFGIILWFITEVEWRVVEWQVACARLATNLVYFALALLLPFVMFAGIFWVQGRWVEYVASLLIYPVLYGSNGDVDSGKRFLLKLALVAEYAQPFMAYALLGIMAALGLACGAVPVYASCRRALRLVLWVSGASLLFLLLVPAVLRPHLWPSLLFACVLGGCLIAHALDSAFWRNPMLGVLWGAVTLVLFCAWGGAQGNPLRDRKNLTAPRLDAYRGANAYVVGVWPKIYTDNRWIPSSSVMYPTALPAAQQTWAFKPPNPDSFKGRILAELHVYNVMRLNEDFHRTPPRVIVVVDRDSKAPDSRRDTDIEVIQHYLNQHCVMRERLAEGTAFASSLFECLR